MKSNNYEQDFKEISKEELEEGKEIHLDFSKIANISKDLKLLPVVVQHYETKDVLMLAYISQEALKLSIEMQKAVFYSTSRNALWIKGDTSGNYLHLKEIRVNCEQNSLLFLVIPENEGVCHTKDANHQHRKTCFYRKIENEHLEFLKEFNS